MIVTVLESFIRAASAHLKGSGQPADSLVRLWGTCSPILAALELSITPGDRVESVLGPAEDSGDHDHPHSWEIRLRQARAGVSRMEAEALQMQFLNLHPWVQDGARRQWQSELYDEAITSAWKMVNRELQLKSGYVDLSDTALVNAALGTSTGRTGRFLRVSEHATVTDQNRQRGMHALGQAIVAGLRNVVAHEVEWTSDANVAMECLVTMSLFAGWVDSAAVVEPDEGKTSEGGKPAKSVVPPVVAEASWSLRHHRGDVYILENVGDASAYDVDLDFGDLLVTRTETHYDEIPAGRELELFIRAVMGTRSERISVTWSAKAGDTKRRTWERIKPPKY